jgi:DNA-binding MarR family transcriptional regulator
MERKRPSPRTNRVQIPAVLIAKTDDTSLVAPVGYGVFAPPADRPELIEDSRLAVALAWISARSAVVKIMGASIILSPAWDMLLDLYVSGCRNHRLTVSDACIATHSPASTSLRWLETLEEQGLVTRSPDPTDKRRVFLALTTVGLDAVRQALDASSESDRKLGLGRLRSASGPPEIP